ncbi:MAG TPA: (Fe-S)-binding protein [Candidatus Ozemobacteraceae bacterium]|nr:(Fe-S)-binding protein [Candidatus Ozemobacteraceae bacterium]
MKAKNRDELQALLREGLSWCMKCGACLSGCPVYRHRRTEGSSMRGKLALLQAIEAGRTLPPETVAEVLSHCTGCQTCRSLCPNGIDTVFLTLVARLILAQDGTHDWTDRAGSSVRKYQLSSRLTLAAMPMLMHGIEGVRAGRLLRSLPRRVFHALRAEPDFAAFQTGSEILFPGCALSQDPPRLQQLERVCAKVGLAVQLTPDLGCCGMPELGIASAQRHEEQVRLLFDRLQKLQPKRILVVCHRCLTGFRYLRSLYHWTAEEASLFDRIDDFTVRLASLNWTATKPLAGSVTVHDPCQLLRVPGAKAATRSILARILSEPVVESSGDGTCCGFGGSFLFRHPTLAGDLRRERVEQLRKTGTQRMVTACTYCADSLELPLRRQGMETSLLIDLLDQALS